MTTDLPACELPDKIKKKKSLELQSVLKEEPNGESYKASMIYWALAMHQVAGRAPKMNPHEIQSPNNFETQHCLC